MRTLLHCLFCHYVMLLFFHIWLFPALEYASDASNQIILVAQKDANTDEPSVDDVYSYGCLANILQMLKLPDGNLKVLVEGISRVSLESLQQKDFLWAEHQSIDLVLPDAEEKSALARSTKSLFERYSKLNKKIPTEILKTIQATDDVEKLSDMIAAHLSVKLEEKQKILELADLAERFEYLMGVMEAEMNLLQVERKIRGRVKKQMDKSQRDYYLNEQIKAIQKELGEHDGVNDLDELSEKVEAAGMTKEALDKTQAEIKKLKMMSPMSAEATVIRGYIDWMLKVPWKKRSRLDSNMEKAQDILENDHYGLEEVKERILEYLAVQTRVKKLKGSVLCLVGPPGVGKTSLGESIAKATGREFIRMSLGGVRDEAEIRGHRRTYIGSMPGRILQKLSKTKVRNPLFLLDEIDKMAMDMRGDPASALLEVLDPEQNSSFNDHYLEVDYDLSEVMFVCTANSMNIPGPLLDRMEVIRLSGYTEEEKLNIASRYLLPKQKKNNGLAETDIHISESSLTNMIRYYTREAGVRNLERELSKVCRKVVKQLTLDSERSKIRVNAKNLKKFLGVEKYDFGMMGEIDQVGQVTGLAWTQVGGDLLTIEAVVTSGKGKMQSTGHLGNVMQESIKAAITVVRARSESLGIDEDFYQSKDIHIHVPEGATPKDGPSAGGAMCTALVSALTQIPVKKEVAMTGEITLRGEVLPIGGLKEKLLAAHRGGIKTVLIPQKNMRDLQEIPANIVADLKVIPVRWIDEVLEKALVKMPEPLSVEKKQAIETKPVTQKISEVDDKGVKTH